MASKFTSGLAVLGATLIALPAGADDSLHPIEKIRHELRFKLGYNV